jgi:chorismate synthase
VRCFDETTGNQMVAAIEAAAADGDSLGGVVEILAFGLPVGLGSHVSHDRKLDGRLGGALMAVPAMKAVEIGEGIRLAGERGSVAHDEISPGLTRVTDRAGGTEGGMSMGTTLRVSAYMKPLSTLKRRLQTVDMTTGEAAEAFQERTDVCAVPAAGVVCETVVALVLADALLEMFGGDTLGDLKANIASYQNRVGERKKR